MSFAKDVKAELLCFTYEPEKGNIMGENGRKTLREAFVKSGHISDPSKSYHLEFVCPDEESAEEISAALREYDIEAGRTIRGRSIVLYIKEGEQIAKLLGLMGANNAYFRFENARIVREMRGSVNRKVNCETANIKKTVRTAQRQIAHIMELDDSGRLSELPRNLREVAKARVKYPDASLSELGSHLDPPVGKSGVNHRLRKLMEMTIAGGK